MNGSPDVDVRVHQVRPVAVPTTDPVEGLRADGTTWRRAWSLPDRLVLDFDGIAALEASDDGTVTVDRPLTPEMEQHLLIDHILPLLLARRGALVVHGAVLELGGRAVVLIGASGTGKSTLSAHAWQQGWTLGGDDGAVLDVQEGAVSVTSTHSTLRLTPEAAALVGIPAEEGAAAVGKRRLRTMRSGLPHRHGPAALHLVAEVQPAPVGSVADFTPLTGVAAHAALFGCTFHADLARGQLLRSVVNSLGTVVEAVSVGRLSVPRGRAGLASAEAVLRREVST